MVHKTARPFNQSQPLRAALPPAAATNQLMMMMVKPLSVMDDLHLFFCGAQRTEDCGRNDNEGAQADNCPKPVRRYRWRLDKKQRF